MSKYKHFMRGYKISEILRVRLKQYPQGWDSDKDIFECQWK